MTGHCTDRVTWSAEDGEHVGLCAEFPSLSWLAATPDEALAGIRRLVRDSVADMQATGETMFSFGGTPGARPALPSHDKSG